MADVTTVIRGFNRTVTQRIGALNTHYLGRNRPLVESRLLFEIGADGVPVRDLRALLGLDSGFVSRTLRSLERCHADCLRQIAGDVPNWRLNARLNAASAA